MAAVDAAAVRRRGRGSMRIGHHRERAVFEAGTAGEARDVDAG
jgi:hypothetical protein